MSDIKDEKKPLTRAEREAKRLEVLVVTKNIIVQQEKKKIEESFYSWTRKIHDMKVDIDPHALLSLVCSSRTFSCDYYYVSHEWIAAFKEKKVKALGYSDTEVEFRSVGTSHAEN